MACLPSNEGRGYIFRRVLRRAVRHGRLLGLEGPFLAKAADTVIDLMKGHYAELAERRDRIVEVLSVEERKFSQTLATGLQLLNREIATLKERGATEMPGEVAFHLYDTHGFPLELTEEVAREHGLTWWTTPGTRARCCANRSRPARRQGSCAKTRR